MRKIVFEAVKSNGSHSDILYYLFVGLVSFVVVITTTNFFVVCLLLSLRLQTNFWFWQQRRESEQNTCERIEVS